MLSFPNAKINIGLHITGKRTDGYHNLETVFYPVAVKDALEITDAPETSINHYGMPVPGLPEDDICLKAFRILSSAHSIPQQTITLFKNIPTGAGLGGGSADAAFLLKLLNLKFSLNLTDADLEEYARQLGADCAFFIKNKPVYASGRGDRFAPVKLDLSGYFIVIVQPPVHISTKEAYAGVTPDALRQPLSELLQAPVTEWKNTISNDFEKTLFVKHPLLDKLKDDLYAQGAAYAQMSGSGSAVYGIFNQPVTLQLPSDGYKIFYPTNTI